MARHGLLLIVALFAAAPAALAAEEPPLQPIGLPYVFHDDFGSTWDVQYDGSIGDGGNDLYDGGGRLTVDGVGQYQSPTQQATFDAARNEVVLPPMQIGAIHVSRRVAVIAGLSAVRFTELVENPGAAAVKVQLRCYFNMGGSVQQAIPLVDPKRPRQQCGHAIGDGNNAVAMVTAGRRAKVSPRMNFRHDDDNVEICYEVDVPARQTVAVVHFQVRRGSAADAAEAWQGITEKQLLDGLSRDLRRRVVNFPAGDELGGDVDIVRGDALDVVEVRGGDAYRGTLLIDRYRLQTAYGPVTLAAERVVALVNVGRYRPTQLVVTADGDVFGGRLDVDALKLRMTGGQVTSIPLRLITRLGYRRRADEPEEISFENQAAAYLQGGQRLRIERPKAELELATPAGPVRLSAAVVSSVVLQGEESTVPEVRLTDGSRLSGLLDVGAFDVTLLAATGGADSARRVRLPAAAVRRLVYAAPAEPEPLAPALTLVNGDVLVGTIGGTLSLETPFDTLHVEGPQIKAVEHTRSGGDHDVTVTLWDDSTLSGRLVESHVTCQLRCGAAVRVPVALVGGYVQPLPLPSPPMVERIREMAGELDADEWAVRERAQARILAIGPPAMSVLERLRAAAPEEGATRMGLILSRLTKQVEAPASERAGGSVGAPAMPVGDGMFNDAPMLFWDR